MRALVTGGAGFIGHHLVRLLVDRGDEVRVLDDFSSGHRSRLAAFESRLAVTEGSVLDPIALDAAMAGCEVVFHEAAVASVARSLEAPRLTDEVNVGGTIEVMLAAARHGVRRVVLAGSSAVYGIPEALPCREDQRPAPTSPYGASKLSAEHYLHTLGALHDVETVALRYFNVFGPGQDPASEYAAVVPRFITSVLDGRRPVINGSGDISRDYVHVDNVVDANLRAADASSPSGLTANIAAGSERSLLDLLRAVSAATGRPVEPVLGPPRPGDIPHSVADISLAQRTIGYAVSTAFEPGIQATVDWYRRGSGVPGEARDGTGDR